MTKLVASEQKRSDLIFFVLAAIVLAAGFYIVPKIIGFVPVSFLSEGAGLNKLLSVIIVCAAFVGTLWSSDFARKSIDLIRGAKVEMRKVAWSKKDIVIRTTIMVLIMVFMSTLLIFLIDVFIGFIVRLFI